MDLVERLLPSHRRRRDRARGREVALGLASPAAVRAEVRGDGATSTAAPEACPSCGRAGCVDLVDLPGGTSHLRCSTCQRTWSVAHAVPLTSDAP